MNLQQMRDLVRAQLDLDDTDLPDALLDAFLQEGYDRVLQLEQRWPFFQFEWDIIFAEDGTAQMPIDASFIEMMITPDGRLLDRMASREAVLAFPPGQVGAGNPTGWSRLNRALYILPAPGDLYTVHATGYRMGSNWIGVVGASGECDCDRRLHLPICWYAASLGYAQQEDEVLEATYLNRFKESSAQARDAIMAVNPSTPKQVAYASYSSKRNGFASTGSNGVVLSLPGVQGPQGPQGPPGPVGPMGAIGPAGITGATGPQGPAGIQGPQGPIGGSGPKGDTGNVGATGPQGPVGATGATGAQGPAGPVGATGQTGAQGVQGVPGPQGAWVQMTQAQYDALAVKDPNVLYIIIG